MSALPIAEATQWATSENGNERGRDGSQMSSTATLLERVTAHVEALKRETPEERAARRAQWKAERIRSWRPHCEKCDRDLAPGETIYKYTANIGEGYFGGSRIRIVAVCKSCLDAAAATRTRVIHYPNHRMHCAECNRPVMVPTADGRYRIHAFCCRRCEADWYACRARALRGEPDRPCKDCGARFTPRRTDSLYCSAACKQRAYRKRAGER